MTCSRLFAVSPPWLYHVCPLSLMAPPPPQLTHTNTTRSGPGHLHPRLSLSSGSSSTVTSWRRCRGNRWAYWNTLSAIGPRAAPTAVGTGTSGRTWSWCCTGRSPTSYTADRCSCKGSTSCVKWVKRGWCASRVQLTDKSPCECLAYNWSGWPPSATSRPGSVPLSDTPCASHSRRTSPLQARPHAVPTPCHPPRPSAVSRLGCRHWKGSGK